MELHFKFLLILFCLEVSYCSSIHAQDLILFPKDSKQENFKSKSLIMQRYNTSLLLVGENGNHDSRIIFTPSRNIEKRNKIDFVFINITNLNPRPIYVIGGINDIRRNSGSVLIKSKSKTTLKVLITSNSPLNKKYNLKGSLSEGIITFPEIKDSLENIHILFDNLQKGDSVLIDSIKIVRQQNNIDFFKAISDNYGQLNTSEYIGKIHKDSDFLNDKLVENNRSNKNDNYSFSYIEGPSFEATGSFRTLKYKNKWWLVDPKGKLFWSRGINCINIDETTNIKNRTFLMSNYRELTSRDSSFSFLRLNLRKKYGEYYNRIYPTTINSRIKTWGINTYGNWSSPDFYLNSGIPYTCNLTSLYFKGFKFPDPFSNEFENYLSSQIRNKFKSQAKDSMCIGFFVDNEIPWLSANKALWEASVDQPAKIKFIKYLKDKYGLIDSINKRWNTSFKSFDDILQYHNYIDSSAQDTYEFVKLLTIQYFKLCKKIISQETSGKLYLGCRFDFQYYPEDKRFNDIVLIASNFCDVVSFNRYRYIARDLVPHDNLDFPILIGEFHFGSLDAGSISPGLLYTQSQESRGQAYQYYITQCLQNRYIVGAHWFQLFDQPITGRYDGENSQIGFLSITDKPYSELIKASTYFNSSQYLIRLKNN